MWTKKPPGTFKMTSLEQLLHPQMSMRFYSCYAVSCQGIMPNPIPKDDDAYP